VHIYSIVMIDFEKYQITIVIITLIALIGLYFLHTWHVKYILADELKNLVKSKKEQKEPEIQQDDTPPNQYDADSYAEPKSI